MALLCTLMLIALNKKVRMLGLRSALSDKAKLGRLSVLEGSKCDGKSSSLKKKLDSMGMSNALVIVGNKVEQNFIQAANNIKHIDVLVYSGLNVYDIVRKENLIIIDDAVKIVEERLCMSVRPRKKVDQRISVNRGLPSYS